MEGKVISVSGSVVIAKGLDNPKMNDIVLVGDKSLVGEIVKLDGENAIIQVYEDTSGLKVEEKAIDTNEPLSVELGPGLIGSIFDGIQRPLDKILEKEGTFIGSGVAVDSLDREKKWHFKPKVSEGQELDYGEEIGEVKESSLIKHRILLPPDKKGKVKKIAEEGEYTIEDTIMVLDNDGKNENIKMMNKWPVRTPRPVKEKLPPFIPLLTGQRVIDTMFPVAMGGTAAVPGPFGSGKCVTGDTPILLGDGSIETIEKVYEEALSSGKIEYRDENETLIKLDSPLKTCSFYGGKVAESASNFIYQGKSDSVLRIKTRTGKKVKVTPIHKLFRLDPDGQIRETPANSLKEGEYIVSIRKFKTNGTDQDIDVYSLFAEARASDESIKAELKSLVKKNRQKVIKSGLKEDIINQITRNENNPAPKIKWIKQAYDALNIKLPRINKLRGDRRGNIVTIPDYMSKELAELLGFYVAEGYLRGKTTFVFTNSDEKLLNRVKYLIKEVFNLDSKIERPRDKTPNVLVNSVILVSFVKKMINARSATDKYIPTMIMKSNDKIISAFLKGYYLGDGSYYKGNIELSTASKKLSIGLSYLLTRLGILHSLSTNKSLSENDRNRIFIRNINELKKFYSSVKSEENEYEKIEKIKTYCSSKGNTYTAVDLVPLKGQTVQDLYRSYSSYSELKSNGLEITNYTGGNEKMSVNSFNKFVQTLSVNHSNVLQIQRLNYLAKALEFVYFDRIEKIEEIPGPFDVYDVVTPEFGSNFVGGEGAILLHNTVIQHQLAKWSDADVIVYVGCGERGNEMTEILTTFPELKDPKSGRPLMDRTILIANTSNMPVAAREASIYTGITIAEYYRDMGYNVAVMADSTSRWAEALRELSGRLEEMPGEEGYPAYLGRRIGEFYERAGRAKLLSGKTGSATIIGAVSPPGGDISEPVSQNTLRVTRVFWALDAALANARHFPSINWLNSYSLYTDGLDAWYRKNIAQDWPELRGSALATLQKEAEINEIVQLVGYDALPESDKLILEISKTLREDYLQQNAFDEVDTYASVSKQYKMLKIIMQLFETEKAALTRNITMEKLVSLPVKQKIARLRYTKEEDIDNAIKEIEKNIEEISKMNSEK